MALAAGTQDTVEANGVVSRLSVVAVAVVGLSYAISLGPRRFVQWAAAEDSIFEYAGAAGFLATSLIFFVLAWWSRRPRWGQQPRTVFWVLLGLLFFFAAGEEISWGTRIFAIDGGDAVRQRNLQGELNLHNLDLFHPRTRSGDDKSGVAALFTTERLSAAFWLGFCVLVPFAHRYVGGLRSLIEKVRLPVVAIQLGLLFPLCYLVSKVLERYLWVAADQNLTDAEVDIAYIWPLIEIKEFSLAFLFLAVAIEFAARFRPPPSL